MSFGFSVSDFYVLVQLANKTRKAFIDAPPQFRAISDEVKTLSSIMRDLEDVIPERTVPLPLSKSLKEHVEICSNLLEEIQSTLKNYHGLHTAGSKPRRIWHRLRWEPEDIKDLRARLSSNIGLLHGINDLLNRHSVSRIQDGVDRLDRLHDDKEFLKIMSWLSAMETSVQQNDLMTKRQSETGLWLLSSNEYLDWLGSSRGTLFCPGLPGGGKTMIAASIIEDLWNKFETDPETGFAFIYFSYKRQHEQTLEECLSSLLKQLVQKLEKIPPGIQKLFHRHKNRMTRPSIDELIASLESVIISYNKVYFVFDALDEYSKVPGSLLRLLQEIFQLQSSRSVNFLATSRPNIPGVHQFFQGKPEIVISAKEEDVRKVLDSAMSEMPTCITKSPNLQALVKDEIIKAVDGMFLLTRLHLNSLRDKLRQKEVIKALKNLPRGSEALDAAYAEAIERIDLQQSGCRDLAKRVLTWISHARKPLTTTELRHALAIELDDPEIDEENIPELEDMVSFCEGLVIVDEESNIIRLVHYTTQEYLDRVSHTWMLDTHKEMALVCLAYLSFDVFSLGSCRTDEEFEDRLQRYVLLDYCAKNWGDHVRDADDEDVNNVALRFLNDGPKIASAVQVRMVSVYHSSGYSKNVPLGIEAVHLAAQFGLSRIMTQLLNDGRDPDPKDGFGRTPFSYAAEYGHQGTVELLTQCQGTEFNSTDQCGRTPLSWAAASNHVGIVETLLSCPGVDANSKDSNLLTPLAWAARRGCVGVVNYLMARNDVEKDARDKGGQTPLSWAAYNGHLEIVKPLAASQQVNVDSKDHFSQTPLLWAARNGHTDVVSFLIDLPGIDADARDDDNCTGLMWASCHGNLGVVKLLASRPDVKTDTKDQHGQTSLSWAAREGHLDIVEYLMARKDVDLQSRDKRGLTPLRWAAWNGYEGVAKVLGAASKRNSISEKIHRELNAEGNIANGEEKSNTVVVVENAGKLLEG